MNLLSWCVARSLCGSWASCWFMRVDKPTQRHAERNTAHPYRRRRNNTRINFTNVVYSLYRTILPHSYPCTICVVTCALPELGRQRIHWRVPAYFGIRILRQQLLHRRDVALCVKPQCIEQIIAQRHTLADHSSSPILLNKSPVSLSTPMSALCSSAERLLYAYRPICTDADPRKLQL